MISGALGKGNRRFPSRDGGRKKSKRGKAWESRAQHLVPLVEIPVPHTKISYGGRFREEPASAIYRFDQEMAKLGLSYFAAWNGWSFEITIPANRSAQIEDIVRNLGDYRIQDN